MKHLTIRDIPENLAEALDEEKRRRGKSLNQTVIRLLKQSLGVPPTGKRKNGLSRLAGTWTAEEHRQFKADIRPSEQIDPELWS